MPLKWQNRCYDLHLTQEGLKIQRVKGLAPRSQRERGIGWLTLSSVQFPLLSCHLGNTVSLIKTTSCEQLESRQVGGWGKEHGLEGRKEGKTREKKIKRAGRASCMALNLPVTLNLGLFGIAWAASENTDAWDPPPEILMYLACWATWTAGC